MAYLTDETTKPGEPTVDELLDPRAAMDDWDRRFWAPGRNLCDKCMPPYLAAHMRHLEQERAAAIAQGVPLGPVGHAGSVICTKCGGPRWTPVRGPAPLEPR